MYSVLSKRHPEMGVPEESGESDMSRNIILIQ
jgi:hypothetical protein